MSRSGDLLLDQIYEIRREYRRVAYRSELAFCRSIARLIDTELIAQVDIAKKFGVSRETVRQWALKGRLQ